MSTTQAEILPTSARYHIGQDELEVEYHFEIKDITALWDSFAGTDLMYSSRFLLAIEEYPPSNMEFLYGILYQGSQAVGISYYQIRLIKLSESLRADQNNNSLWARIKNWFASKFKGYTLISGNALVTGDYNLKLNIDVSSSDRYQIQERAAVFAAQEFSKRKKVICSFMKDFHPHQIPKDEIIEKSTFSEFSVQPNMIFKVRDEWQSFDDYMKALKSKYRVRVKRAKKKFGENEKRELSFEDIERYNRDIYKLYRSIAEQAGFNLFYLHPDHFLGMKRHFPNLFKVYGYFDGEEILAFFTTFDNGDELEAHFLGYNHDRNSQHQLYLNMLLDLIYVSFKNKHKTIHLSRTALEIKSSIGAEPIDMNVYLRHNNNMINKMVPRALAYFVPKEEWKPRDPYK